MLIIQTIPSNDYMTVDNELVETWKETILA
jgi:hypothetical protein